MSRDIKILIKEILNPKFSSFWFPTFGFLGVEPNNSIPQIRRIDLSGERHLAELLDRMRERDIPINA